MLTKLLGLLGTALLLAGLGLGFRPVSATGGTCGSLFDPAAGITPMACDSKLATTGWIIGGLVAAGIVAVAVALVLITRRDRQLSRDEQHRRIHWR